MQSFEQLSALFAAHFNTGHFPGKPASLYGPNDYFLSIGGKRVRPVLCLMGNELFGEIIPDAWQVGIAIELFHNFTLIHDDIMDKAPLRRGMETVHTKYNESTAILAGDVMMVKSYEYLNKVQTRYIHNVLDIFNQTAREVCEGQQLDMDFEQVREVEFDTYLEMIGLKTSVLLAASLRLGAILGGAGEGNQQLIYSFGKKLGLAFQVQDDYLDAFGDPGKFGKQVGGDILSNKKTFLLIHALKTATGSRRARLDELIAGNAPDKVQQVLALYRESEVDQWAVRLKDQFLDEALQHLDDIAVMNVRKEPLRQLARFLVQREH
ncbi:MAG: polyprenyl synthetase family protein [Chitinophagaceae bacterium]|nr:MAG: polyprenyl synthetase family protein [Chitinophagaceae bacterium]